MEHNLGKASDKQKSFADVVNLSFAYQDIEPIYEVPR